MHIDELETPVAIIDLNRVEANRPHIKTHKLPALPHMQLEAGAAGITFIPYNVIGASKLKRLATLARKVTVSVTVDSEFTLHGISEAASRDGVTITVLVEFDTGVQTPQEAASPAHLITELPGVTFGGLMTYPTNENTSLFVKQVRKLIELHNITLDRVSSGGTLGMWQAHTHPGVTEYRGILDAGSKTLASDLLGLEGHGLILEYPDAMIFSLSEEHGHVDFFKCASKPPIGERVTIIPNHCCVVSNLFSQIVGVRDDTIELMWDVAAHGLLT